MRGDRDDVFSRGYLCPKGTAIKHLETDPDRVRTPMIRRGDDVARGHVGRSVRGDRRAGSATIRAAHGNDAVAAYLGNPNAHNLGPVLYNRRGRCRRSAAATSTARARSTRCRSRCRPGLMFGAALTVPVPDVDRTDYLLMLGANPFASNGSLWTAPDLPGRLRALRARGGTSRRRRSAPLRRPPKKPTSTSRSGPAPTRCSCSRSCTCSSPRISSTSARVADARRRRRRRSRGSPRRSRPSASRTQRVSTPSTIRRIARELAAARRRPRCTPASARARRSSARSRRGSSTCCNVLTGNLDRPGGAMFAKPATGRREHGRHAGHGPRRALRSPPLARARAARVLRRAARSSASPRRSRRRATVRCARCSRSPATRRVSTPDCDRLDARARHARLHGERRHLPQRDDPPRGRDPARRTELARGHYDIALYNLAIRNVANYSPPLVELEAGRDAGVADRCCGSAAILGGQGADADIDALDDFVDRRARAEGGDAARVERRRPRRRRAPEGSSRRGADRSASSTSCCAPVPTATGSVPTPTV